MFWESKIHSIKKCYTKNWGIITTYYGFSISIACFILPVHCCARTSIMYKSMRPHNDIVNIYDKNTFSKRNFPNSLYGVISFFKTISTLEWLLKGIFFQIIYYEIFFMQLPLCCRREYISKKDLADFLFIHAKDLVI